MLMMAGCSLAEHLDEQKTWALLSEAGLLAGDWFRPEANFLEQRTKIRLDQTVFRTVDNLW